MGWYYTNGGSRASLIRELTETVENAGTRWQTLAHCCSGNVLWSVREVHYKVPIEGKPDSVRFIKCDLLQAHKDGWGYKPMEECMHPYYWSCPLKYLEMVPEVASASWREGVRKYWAERKARRRAA